MIGEAVAHSTVNPVTQISVTAYIGSVYGSFPIDLARELHLIATPEIVHPTAVVDLPGLSQLPAILVHPLPDLVADKVCTMYEHHGETRIPSTRYRDLVDLALIVTSCRLDAAPTAQALKAESHRRAIHLPKQLASPGPGWQAGYAAIARLTGLDANLHTLTEALDQVGRCLNPLLDGTRTIGYWDPDTGWN